MQHGTQDHGDWFAFESLVHYLSSDIISSFGHHIHITITSLIISQNDV